MTPVRELGGYVNDFPVLRCACGGMPQHLFKLLNGAASEWAMVCSVCSACTKQHPSAAAVHAAWNRGETPFTWMIPGPPPWEAK